MRSSHNNLLLIEALKSADPVCLIHVLDHGINMEKLNLDVNKLINNNTECLKIRHRIADAKIMSLILSGDLTH